MDEKENKNMAGAPETSGEPADGVRGEAESPNAKREEPLREVVECYEQSSLHEVVETYVQPRPLPRRPSAAGRMENRKNRRRGLIVFLLCIVVLTGVAVAARFLPALSFQSKSDGGNSSGETEQSESSSEVSIPTAKAGKDVEFSVRKSHGAEMDAQSIYQKVNPSVVTVLVQLKSGAAVGTGVIFTSDGYLLTNYHVVAGGKDCSVTLNTNATYAAKYVAGDETNDIAILKISAGKNLPAAEIGSSDALTVGDKVYAIGNPLGTELRGTFTDGIVSAINRNVEVDGKTMTLVQTNAALNSGNSGGPLINVYGQVVGINTIKMSSNFSSTNIEGLGFALPTSSLQYIIADLLTSGKVLPEPLLGISVEKLGTTLPDGTVGAKVVTVTQLTPAYTAGIRKGDVIVTADGESVHSSDDILRIRHRFRVGDQMKITVWRDGKYMDFTLDLQEPAG